MKIPFNTQCFDKQVRITSSGELGNVTGFSRHKRSKVVQFYVEYVSADGRAVADWFFEDQLTAL